MKDNSRLVGDICKGAVRNTEKNTGMAEMHEGQKLYMRLINESLSAGIVISHLDLNRPLDFISDNILHMLGYTYNEFYQKYLNAYRDLIYQGDYENVRAVCSQCRKERLKNYELEYRFIKKNGGTIWVINKGTLINAKNEDPAYLCVIMDITKQKKTRDELQIRNEEYRIVLESCNTIVYRFDILNHSLYMPRELAEKFKLPAEVKNVPFSAIEEGYIARESIQAYVDFYESAEKGIEGKTAEIKRKIGDGSYRWFEGRYEIIRNEKGLPVSAVIIYRDITEKKQQETEIQTLRENEEALKIAAKQPERHLVGYNIRQDRIEAMDAITKAFFARIPKERFSEHFLASGIVSRESENKVKEAFRKIRSGYQNGNLYIKAKDANEKWQWYQCDFAVTTDENGEPSYAVLDFRYATALHNKEMAWRMYHDLRIKNSKEILLKRLYDLTLDIREEFPKDSQNAANEVTAISFEKSVQGFAATYILPSDRDEFCRFLSKERLISAFSNGTVIGSEEFRFLKHGGNTGWGRVSYQMLLDPYSDDLKILIICKDISKGKEKAERLTREAQIDGVTDIYNRTVFKQQVEESSRETDPGMLHAFVLIDLDHFKSINDRFGHIYGDKVLQEAAHTVSSVLFKKDIIGRMGGDAFGISMSGFANREELVKKLEIIRRSICIRLDDHTELTASIGVSVSPEDGRTFEELYWTADAAQFHSKMMGGNCVTFYEKGMPDRMQISASISEPGTAVADSATDICENGIYIRTFGYFDIFVNGKAVPFRYAKTKELLALLVDRRGGFVTSEEIVSCLWENETANKLTLARSRKVALHLKNTLKEYGIDYIIEAQKGSRRILPEKVQCDLYQYLSGKEEYRDLFRGSYMSNYTWGEIMLADLQAGK